MTKLTVVIPCYNAEKFIEKCIEALKKQDYEEFQVIFVDDASTDGTVQRIKSLCSGAPFEMKLLQNSENSGPAASRNKGVQFAETEYVAFCDCDDWYDSSFLSMMVEKLDTDKSDIVFCGYRVVDEQNNIDERPLCVGSLKSKEQLLILDADSLCMMVVKTKLMRDTLIPDIRNGEDMAVIPLLLAKSNNCSIIEQPLYNYFRRSSSASMCPTMKVVDSLVRSYDYIVQNYPISSSIELEYIGIRNLVYASLITLFSFSYEKNKAIEIMTDFENRFPEWRNNPYISGMPIYKKIVVKLAGCRCFLAIRWIALIRTIITMVNPAIFTSGIREIFIS